MAATDAQHQKAKAIDRQIDQLALARLPMLRSRAIGMRRSVIAAFRRHESIDTTVQRYAEDMQRTLIDVQVAAHLQARLSVMIQAADAMRRRDRRRRGLDRIDSAVSLLESRLSLHPEQLQQLRMTYGDIATEVVRGFGEEINARLSSEIATSLRSGEHVKEGVKRLRVAFNSMGIGDRATPHLLETTFRTQTQMAWSAGEWNADQDPAVDEILWGYEYVTVGDDRVRPSHDALDGVQLPKDDPFWQSSYPPNGFNCRCRVLRVFDLDDQEIVRAPGVTEIDGVQVVPGPDEGFDFNPGILARDIISLPRPGIAASIPAGVKGRWRVLAALHLLGGDALQRDIALAAGRSRGSVSKRINKLADEGLVEHDPAGHGCSLTTAGENRAAALV